MIAVGLRWDFHSQADCKLQWARMFVKEYGGRLWLPSLTTLDQSREIDVISLTIDFVF